MFNFKKFKKQVKEAAITVVESVHQPTIEQQIHNDVYSAQELLLEEANRVIAIPLTFSDEKKERLKKLESMGFSNIKEISTLRKEEDAFKQQVAVRAHISYYSINYPFNKFIDQETVKKICTKYKLILGGVANYISDIPVKNQNEIVNFKVRRADVREPAELDRGYHIMPFRMHINDSWERLYKQALTLEDQVNILKTEDQRRRDHENEKIQGTHLLIVAPQHKFNTDGLSVVDGILRNATKDPIVLQPVDGGYLIVSSWGLEASDEMVVNNINN